MLDCIEWRNVFVGVLIGSPLIVIIPFFVL